MARDRNTHGRDQAVSAAVNRSRVAALAVPWFRRSLDKEPNNPIFHFHLGLAYAKSNDSAQARTSLERALTLKPDFPGADEARKVLASLDE